MASGQHSLGSVKHDVKERFKQWLKTTPALVISLAAASTVIWGVFTYAVRISPIGEQVMAQAAAQEKYDDRLNDITKTVSDNAAADVKRHNETMAELYTVQILGMIDRSMGNPNARQQILVLHQKIEGVGGNNDYIEYEVSRYIKSLE